MTKFVILKEYGSAIKGSPAMELVVFKNEIDESKLKEEYDKLWDLNLYPDGWDWDDLMDLLDKFGEHTMYEISGDGGIVMLEY